MQRAAFLVGAVALVVLTGCPPTYPKCSNDDACKEHNEVCVQGQCQECAQDANCKPGFVCQTNKCVPKPECTNDTSCPSGAKCKDGKCSDACQQDSDCGAGKCRNNHCNVNACTTKADCGAGQDCQEGLCSTPTTADKGACSWEPLKFGFNDTVLAPESRAQLDTLADCIKKAKGKVTLEGNADERGTEEYNLQLSNRRAASVKKYLVDLGVPAAKLETVGYGENRPTAQGHDEAAWAANRRVEFKH